LLLKKHIVYRNYFEFEYLIGRGGFSKVWQVKFKKNSKRFAMKEMSKVKIIDKKSEKCILGERDFLSKLKHPFIVNMICSFQDYENLYLLMDLLTGGDLRFHFNIKSTFSEKEVKFFISCIILSLEYIHENNIIHRDIKPENLVSDDKGYIRLTDFGIAKIKKEQNSSETSGTPGYMAPEVLNSQNHSFTVDFYAIGIIGYEFLIGKRPYIGKNRKEIKQLVLSKEAYIEENKDKSWSKNCLDFINRCLKRKVSNRLGYNFGIKELKTHPWFDKYDWKSLYNKTLEAPFIPKKDKNYDKEYCEKNDKVSNSTFERYKGYMKKNDYIKIFEGYTYFDNDFTSNTIENETVTSVSTNTKGNKQEKQEVYEEQSYRNFFSNDNHDKTYDTPLKKFVESSISNNNKWNKSVEHKILLKDINNQKMKLEKYQCYNQNNLFNTLMLKKLEQNKTNLNKKQISVEILSLNKKIRNDLNYKLSENDYINNDINYEKENSLELNRIINSKDNINISNNIDDKIQKLKDDSKSNRSNNISFNTINSNRKKIYNFNDNNINFNINNIKSLSGLNFLNKLKKFNNSNSIVKEKEIQVNNENFGKNMNISMFNFKTFKKKKLNIHSLSSEMQTKEFNIENNKNKILPICLPLLNKNNSTNPHQHLLIPNIKQFNFTITKKKKIKYINFNQNKIVENTNINQEGQKSPLTQFLYKCVKSTNLGRNYKNDLNNNLDSNTEICKKIVEEAYLPNNGGQLGKSQSSELFPKIKKMS
jgi:serum/glucocorticoid-regulated kinase 2